MPQKNCYSCGCADQMHHKCQILGVPCTKDECRFWTDEPTHCRICGNIIPLKENIIWIESEQLPATYVPICGKCQYETSTCRTCVNKATCDFETNPSPIQKAVENRIQMGNLTTVGMIKNPERIEITCKQNCECWDENLGCLKERLSCEKYKGEF